MIACSLFYDTSKCLKRGVALSLALIEHFRRIDGEHCYRMLEFDGSLPWVKEAATRYRELRTASPTPISAVIADGITLLDTAAVEARAAKASIPTPRTKGPSGFNILRSDFGELLAILILRQEFGTQFGYLSLRDRELPQVPGRGIDTIGIEVTPLSSRLRLVLTEVKVSDEGRTPPRVVDAQKDAISVQHRQHIGDLSVTSDKVFEVGRKTLNEDLRNYLMAASTYIDNGDWDKLEIVCCAVLVRSVGLFKETDFGTILTDPTNVSPATVRFLILCTPEAVDQVVKDWYDATGMPAMAVPSLVRGDLP